MDPTIAQNVFFFTDSISCPPTNVMTGPTSMCGYGPNADIV